MNYFASRLLKNSTACVIARMRSQNSDGSRYFAGRAELSSALGEVEKCHEGIFQQAAKDHRCRGAHAPSRHVLVWSVLSLAVLLSSASGAGASCGDYVVYGKHAARHGRMDQEPATGHGSPVKPCRGPNCSQAPAQAPSSPSLTKIWTSDDLSLFASVTPPV